MIVGTAGHIDHGKSRLIEALTGRAMDPLAEERRRGITLDLHFAALELPDLGAVGVVDVPGHEDLVRTMVAGASGLDLVLLVVAADEGVMPQTQEHLAVVEQLGIRHGIPVITKADLVDPPRLEAVTAEVTALVQGSPTGFAPPVAVSANTGAGLDALRRLLVDRASHPRDRDAGDLARIPIDRAFALPGRGPIVTGTTWSGTFRVGDGTVVLPAGHRARIRSLGRHGLDVEQAGPGERLAVALSGVELAQLGRGQTLVHANVPWEATRVVDAELALLRSARRPLMRSARVRVHLGTLEVMARVHPRDSIEPGQRGLARLVLEAPTVARGGDRLVLRSYSPVEVIGGGWVVDPLPPRGKPVWLDDLASDDPQRRLEALLQRRPGGLPQSVIPVLLGVTPEAAGVLASPAGEQVGNALVPRGRLREAEEAGLAVVRAYQENSPGAPGIPRETLRQELGRYGMAAEVAVARLLGNGTLVADQAVIREAGFRPRIAGGGAAVDQVVQLVAKAGLTPPSIQELCADHGLADPVGALRIAAREGRLIPVGRERYYSPEALARFTAALGAVWGRGPITPGAVREATGLSRKYLIPLLEWADQAGFTVRRGDARVAGPRLGA
jgi:selenocysteine-specific elongation factor